MNEQTTWRSEWSLGIPVLDRDHRALMAQLEKIADHYAGEPVACFYPGDSNGLVDALEALGEAARAHFQRTTAIMRAIDYEGIDAHISESALLMAEYVELLRLWRKRRLTVLDEDSYQIVREWLLGHIFGVERSFVTAFNRVRHHAVTAVSLSVSRTVQLDPSPLQHR